MEGEHAALAFGFAADQPGLDLRHRGGGEAFQQVVGCTPRFSRGVARDDMQSDPVGEGPSGLGGQFPDPADLLCDGSGRFAPRQISVDVAGRHAEGSGGGATEVEGRPLRGRLVEYRFLNREVRAAEGDSVPSHNRVTIWRNSSVRA